MDASIQNALDIFAQLLPDYLPSGPGNPNDLHRWIDVCYRSCVTGEAISVDDVARTIAKYHGSPDDEAINETAANCIQVYEEYSTLLDYLKNRGLLVLPK